MDIVLNFGLDIRACLGREEPALPLCVRVMLENPTLILGDECFCIRHPSRLVAKEQLKLPAFAVVGR
jgi:hypothetical protein